MIQVVRGWGGLVCFDRLSKSLPTKNSQLPINVFLRTKLCFSLLPIYIFVVTKVRLAGMFYEKTYCVYFVLSNITFVGDMLDIKKGGRGVEPPSHFSSGKM